jgi:hypothetical protein
MLIAGNAWSAGNGYMIGAGVETDSTDGMAASVFGDFGVSEKTWISAAIVRSSSELLNGDDLNTVYGDLGIDHFFKPIGIRAGVSYWGDPDVLDAVDWRSSLYLRGANVMLAGEFDFRDIDFTIPRTDTFPGRTIAFNARGAGLSARLDLSDAVSLRLSGMDYDYSISLRLDPSRDDLIRLLTATRLSLINSLVDYRVNVGLGFDIGSRHLEFDVALWRGAVDGGRTTSATMRFLTPMSASSDIEFGLGYDDSELYGETTFFSVFLYFYGGT